MSQSISKCIFVGSIEIDSIDDRKDADSSITSTLVRIQIASSLTCQNTIPAFERGGGRLRKESSRYLCVKNMKQLRPKQAHKLSHVKIDESTLIDSDDVAVGRKSESTDPNAFKTQLPESLDVPADSNSIACDCVDEIDQEISLNSGLKVAILDRNAVNIMHRKGSAFKRFDVLGNIKQFQ
jgi:hypothetical protein